jgi:hypothetical protein
LLKKGWQLLAQLSVNLIVLTVFSGCLYSTQHFNNGRLLEPGHSHFNLGGGVSHFPEPGCPDYWDEDIGIDGTTAQCKTNRPTFDSASGQVTYKNDSSALQKKWISLPKIGLDYRLGVSGKWGPFTGTEIGLHLEGPTNPITAEFDLKFGLPIPKKLSIQHSLSAGWMIGAWADNSYFAEYAISKIWGENCLFANYRFTRLATQPADLVDSFDDKYFNHKQRWIHQASLGFTWTLPEVMILPDFIVPQAILSYPLAPFGQDKIPEYFLDEHALDFNLGFGWNFK